MLFNQCKFKKKTWKILFLFDSILKLYKILRFFKGNNYLSYVRPLSKPINVLH